MRIRSQGPVWAICGAFGLTLLVRPAGGDVWWHIRAGQWIWQHGGIPDADPFSHTAEGPWRYTEWLAQLLFAGLHGLGGIDAIVWMHVALGAFGAWLVARLARPVTGGTAAVTVALWGAATHAATALKPQVFSYLGAALVLGLLLSTDRDGKWRRLWALPPLLLLWANLHRGGVLGLAFVAAALLASLGRARRPPDDPPAPRPAPLLAAVLVLSAGALLANPGGTFYLTSALDLAGREGFRQLADWQPLSWELLASRHVAWVALAVAWLVERMRSRRRPDLEALLVLGTTILALRSVRFVPFAAMAMVPGAAREIDSWRRAIGARIRSRTGTALMSIGLTCGAVAVVAATYFGRVPSVLRGTSAVRWQLPTDAAAFLSESPPPGRMWNEFDLGGYLLYALAPRIPVFIDGRNDTVYGASFFARTLQAPFAPEVFRQQQRTHAVRYVVHRWSGRPAEPRFHWLHRDPDWQLVYWDDVAAILVERSEQTAAYLEQHGYRELRVGDAFARVARLGDEPADRRLAREVLQNLRQAPHSLRAHYLAGLVHHARRDQAAYGREREWVSREAARRGLDLRLPPP